MSIFEQPFCRIAKVVDAGIAKRQTASEYLAKLADIGVLAPVQGGREKLFIHRALLDLLASETHEAPSHGSLLAVERATGEGAQCGRRGPKDRK